MARVNNTLFRTCIAKPLENCQKDYDRRMRNAYAMSSYTEAKTVFEKIFRQLERIYFRRYPWVLEPVLYEDQGALLKELESKVIAPAEAKAIEPTQK